MGGLVGNRIWQLLGASVVGGAPFKKAGVVVTETKRREHLFDATSSAEVGLWKTLRVCWVL